MYFSAFSREGDLTKTVRYMWGKDESTCNISPSDCKRLFEGIVGKNWLSLFKSCMKAKLN